MCVIVVKRVGVEMPSWDILRACYNANPDGAGFMWADGKQVHIRKGYMTWKAFRRALGSFLEKDMDFKKTSMVFHFRIATHGGVEPALTQPFPVVSDFEKMRKLRGPCEYALAHNGVIAGYRSEPHLSDTMQFIRDWVTHRSDTPSIGMSKMVLLDKMGHITRIGSGWSVGKSGLCYSNKYWLYYLYGEFGQKR